MRKINENIDKVFRDGFSDFRETPPPYIWDSVNENLSSARDNRRILLLWRNISAAAIVVIAVLSTIILTQQKTQLQNTELSQNLDINKNIPSTKLDFSQTADTLKKNIIINAPTKPTRNSAHEITSKKLYTSNITQSHNEESISIKYNNKEAKPPHFTDDKNKESILGIKTKEVSSSSSNIQEQTANNTLLKDSINVREPQKNITESEKYYAFNEIEQTQKKKAIRYTISGEFSRGYSNKNLSSQSSSALKEEGINTIGGGINLNVKTRKKWSFETGVYYAQAGQKFSNNLYNSSPVFAMALNSINSSASTSSLNNSMGDIKLNEQKVTDSSISNIAAPVKAISSRTNIIGNINIQQELEFIEIPLMVRYHVIDFSSFNLSLAGGMSTNVLIGNHVYYVKGKSKELIGETEDINNINYSAIVALGLKAPVWKSIYLNLEPRLKYFMNSLSSEGDSDYKPYSVGIFTGLSYVF